jgi:hypothetical protein
MKPLVAEWVQDKFLPNRKMFHTRFTLKLSEGAYFRVKRV